MNKKIFTILFVFVLSIHCYAQNKIQLGFGIGPNATSAYVNYLVPPYEGIIMSKFDYGIDVRTTISIPIKYNFKICGSLEYSFSKSKIEFDKSLGHDINFQDSTYWHVDSNLSDHSLGVSIGIKKKIIENFSISLFLMYKKIIDREFDNNIHTNKGGLGYWLYRIREIPIFDDYSSSIELTYNITNRISIASGFEYSFTKADYFPTNRFSDIFKFYGNRYKTHLLLIYTL